ncbi:MAG: right-handed parallel beta-helix repeat-containing protein [Deltaproteobacteria bacterium]|nr:right-handed parallel beta-helix repeat-containing protein [Deltaproteobacteria bacterium]
MRDALVAGWLLAAALPSQGWAQSEVRVTSAQGSAGIVAALSGASPGTRIVTEAGTYFGPVQVSGINGTSAQPIELLAEGTVILDARGSAQESVPASASSLSISSSSNLLVEGFELTSGRRGIFLSACDSVVLRGNHVHDVNEKGIVVSTSAKTTVSGNRIERIADHSGIASEGTSLELLITDNVVVDTHIHGIVIADTALSPIVRRNIVQRSGVYPSFEGGAGALIENNLLIDIGGQGMTVLSPDAIIRNNVLDEWTWSGILANEETLNLALENNIFRSSAATVVEMPTAARATLDADYNQYVLGSQSFTASESFADWQATGQDLHGFLGPAPFVSDNAQREASAVVYTLRTCAAAVDHGSPALEDADQPPGLGAARSDLGIFGGPGNGWAASEMGSVDAGCPGDAGSDSADAREGSPDVRGPADGSSLSTDGGDAGSEGADVFQDGGTRILYFSEGCGCFATQATSEVLAVGLAALALALATRRRQNVPRRYQSVRTDRPSSPTR